MPLPGLGRGTWAQVASPTGQGEPRLAARRRNCSGFNHRVAGLLCRAPRPLSTEQQVGEREGKSSDRPGGEKTCSVLTTRSSSQSPASPEHPLSRGERETAGPPCWKASLVGESMQPTQTSQQPLGRPGPCSGVCAERAASSSPPGTSRGQEGLGAERGRGGREERGVGVGQSRCLEPGQARG